jgi:hypothetical protein
VAKNTIKNTAAAFNGGFSQDVPRRSTRELPDTPVVERCPERACGAPADLLDESDPHVHGWIQTLVTGSREPGRWWCSPRCAQRGIALAQLRMNEPWPTPGRPRARSAPGPRAHPKDTTLT